MLQSPGYAQACRTAQGAASAAKHIVVVEGDAPLRAQIARLLRESGYSVTSFPDGAALIPLISDQDSRPIDLVLLDEMLPGDDGLALCARIRNCSNVPVIVISTRGQEADRVAGLDAGADDYISRPFGRSEFLARIRALLRRAAMQPRWQEAADPAWLRFADWRYNVRGQELFAASGAEVVLTAAEHELLLTLLRNPQRTIGRERLLELSRQRIANANDRSVDVLVSRLRRKMGGARKAGSIIRSVRGVGYMLAVDVQPG